MDLSHAGYEVNLGSYKKPLSSLAKRFEASVELWKTKYRQLESEIERYQNRADDARRSRDHWKEQAQQWQASAEQIQAEFGLLRSQHSGPKNKPPQQTLLVDLKSIRAQMPGFTLFSGQLGNK